MKKRGEINIEVFPGKNHRGQIWIETVIYTLIAFAMISLVLAYAKPKIEEMQDKAIIEQSLAMIKDIEMTLLTMGGSGNQRIVELSIKKGDLKIDGKNDKIIFDMESKFMYSDLEVPVYDGNVQIVTKKKGKLNQVNLTRNFYDSYNISYSGKDEIRTISKSPVSYTLKVLSKGEERTITTEVCTTIAQCPPPTGFSPECVDGHCEYIAGKTTIDFEII